MTEVSPGLGLPYLQPSQAQKHVTHNAALQLLDQLVQLRITTFDALTPPALPVTGETHALAVGATGAWAGQDGMLALWEATGWRFLAPQEGWLSWDLGTARLRSWSAAMGWTPVQLDQLDMLGIGTPADASNRLSVSAPATLLSHTGGGHQLKINKAADGDTASLLFQSNWLGHAELGLVGDTAFALKLSADGTSWTEVMRADPLAQKIDWATAGLVQMSLAASALQLDVPLTGTAVQASAADTTPGRLMRADYGYGPGNLLGAVSQSAGNPTGAVIETGSTINGHYSRFADGTQLCWHQATLGSIINAGAGTWDSPYFTPSMHWTYPAVFVGTPQVFTESVPPASAPNLSRRSAFVGRGVVNDTTAYNVVVGRYGSDATADVFDVSLSAVGRWF